MSPLNAGMFPISLIAANYPSLSLPFKIFGSISTPIVLAVFRS
jgi:hypothetical protein